MRTRALLLLALALAATGVGKRTRERIRKARSPVSCAQVVTIVEADGERLACVTDPALASCGDVIPGERYVGCEPQGAIAGQVLLPRGLPIDANRASSSDLEALPGIGPGLAERIVGERDSGGGPFVDSEDLQRVSGIGEKRSVALEPYLTFDGE